jgi:ribose 5-phosphate isomerase B
MSLIALGADHAGWELKEDLKAWLIQNGHQVVDFGTHSPDSVDYPDYATQVAEAVAAEEAQRGLLVCGTGIGMSMVANKVPGIRAALCGDAFTARMSREHNDANVLALGARLTGRETAVEILKIWLDSEFAGGRHARRVQKIADFETTLMMRAEGERPSSQARRPAVRAAAGGQASQEILNERGVAGGEGIGTTARTADRRTRP